jgi:LAO/AO transport system kinase
LKKDIRALARAITYVENDHEEKLELMSALYPAIGRARYIGITGSPGAGKSTFVNRLIDHLRSLDLHVGVCAVDPTSPFSGGAILGDRVRMAKHFTDPKVYIRSMGTRGSLGGLSRTTKDAIKVMDAYGFDVILIETVGVGQSELDIMKIADTTAVVLTPGSGDVVQVFKAGIMEIADLFVINKADQPGVGPLHGQINAMLDLVQNDRGWRPPIKRVSAVKNEGIMEFWLSCEDHFAFLENSGVGARRRKSNKEKEVLEIIQHEASRRIEELFTSEKAAITDSEMDPYTLARDFVDRYF